MRASAFRGFEADPLLNVAGADGAPNGAPSAPQDLRHHPVIAAIHERAAQRSRPGARSDGRRIALVIEGGGMRGAVSAGMAAAIEQLGLLDAFDEVYGASAGAFNAAFLLAGQAAYLAALYPHGFGNPRFASALRVLTRGRPPFDMDYVVEHVWREQRPLRTERILTSPIELHCAATDAHEARAVDLAELASDAEIRTAMLASARLPWLGGPPVRFRGRLLLDATLAEAVPIEAASRAATDLLVLLTRPEGVNHAPLSSWVAKLTDRYLARINPKLVDLRMTRSERYDRLIAELTARAADPAGAPRLCIIRPARGTPVIGQLESRAGALLNAAGHGFRAAWFAFAGANPELLRSLRAYV